MIPEKLTKHVLAVSAILFGGSNLILLFFGEYNMSRMYFTAIASTFLATAHGYKYRTLFIDELNPQT